MDEAANRDLIVLNIGFDLGVIPEAMFTILVLMAVATKLMTGPLLRLLLPGLGHTLPEGLEA